jgi:pyruvate dehydrogenase E1 component alpha subunit
VSTESLLRPGARPDPKPRLIAAPVPEERAPLSDERERDLVQLLTPDGQRVASPEYDLNLAPDEYRGLYRDLVLIRRFDQEATALQRQGELGIWAPLLGQEAAQVGSARALRRSDFAFPTYREHGVAYCRGVDPVDVLGLFRGTTLGGWDPSEHGLALYTIVVGAQTLHAVGYAMGISRDGADEAVLAYFGDGATSQGDVNESFVCAASYQAPVVFFCTNNGWAISEPTRRQSPVPLVDRAAGFGFPGVAVDGNDVLAVLAVTRAALEAARRGDGPQLIEAVTYRMGAHTTSDDPTRYRSAADLDRWRHRDPLSRLRRMLEREALADDEFFTEIDQAAEALAEHVRSGCRALPDPQPEDLFRHVYVDEPPLLTAQRQSYAAYLASFVEED